MKLRSLSVIAVAGAFSLAACGSNSSTSPATAASRSTTTTTTAAFNQADVTFAQSMIPHHQQAIEMADMALDAKAGASAKVRDLATRIKAGQGSEVQTMTAWLTAWGQTIQMGTMPGSEMSSMEGMMSTAEMDTLHGMTGVDFDKMWLRMMTRHHQGAIAMAQTLKAAGSNPDAVALASLVIVAQQSEISEMQALLAS
jgi:uncharacterized protein (DUF305 family)